MYLTGSLTKLSKPHMHKTNWLQRMKQTPADVMCLTHETVEQMFYWKIQRIELE